MSHCDNLSQLVARLKNELNKERAARTAVHAAAQAAAHEAKQHADRVQGLASGGSRKVDRGQGGITMAAVAGDPFVSWTPRLLALAYLLFAACLVHMFVLPQYYPGTGY